MTLSGRVSPFGNPRITGCSPLPAAYRSVPRPSSPLSAKASTKCPYTLRLIFISASLASHPESRSRISENRIQRTERRLHPDADSRTGHRPSFRTRSRDLSSNPGATVQGHVLHGNRFAFQELAQNRPLPATKPAAARLEDRLFPPRSALFQALTRREPIGPSNQTQPNPSPGPHGLVVIIVSILKASAKTVPKVASRHRSRSQGWAKTPLTQGRPLTVTPSGASRFPKTPMP